MAYKRKSAKRIQPTRLKPNVGVVQTTPGDRVIGSMHSIELTGTERTVFHDLACDIYYSLYKFNPQLVAETKLPPERLVTRAMMEHVMQQDYFLNARVNTALSTPAAYAATKKMWETLMNDNIVMQAMEMAQAAEDKISKAREKMEQGKNQQKGRDKQNNQDKQDNQSDQSDASQDKQGDQDGQSQSKAQSEYDEAIREAKALANRVEKSGLLDRSIANAVKEAEKEAEEVGSRMSSWGFGRESLSEISPDTAMKLADNNDWFINQIAEAVGRVTKAASSALEQVREGYIGPPTRVADTRDFSRIFPTERLYLSTGAPPIMRAMKVSQYTRSGLLGWQPASEGQKSGPFVAYVDGSGSMNGEKHIAAKAIAYGLARALMTDNRRQNAFRLREFGSEDMISGFISHDSKPDEIIAWVEHFFSSNRTDFDTPLMRSIRDVEELRQNGVQGADVLMITDGQVEVSGHVQSSFNRMREQYGVRLFYIVVHDGHRSSERRDLKEMCDFEIAITASDFFDNSDKLAVEIVKNMYRKGDNHE